MPFSGEPKHPPALVVQLRGQQHSGAALWVEPACKCERYFPCNSKGFSFSHSLGKIEKQTWRCFCDVATGSDDLRFILKQSTEMYTNEKQTDLLKVLFHWFDSGTYWFAAAQQCVNISIGTQLLSALLRFKLKLKAAFRCLACYGNICEVVDA